MNYRDVLELKDVQKVGLSRMEMQALNRVQMFVRNQGCAQSTYEIIELLRSHLHYNIVGLADLIHLAPKIEQLANVPDNSWMPEFSPSADA